MVVLLTIVLGLDGSLSYWPFMSVLMVVVLTIFVSPDGSLIGHFVGLDGSLIDHFRRS